MCGIFGAVGSDAANVDAVAALARIAHRGPDGEGIWRSEGFGVKIRAVLKEFRAEVPKWVF